MNSPSSSKIGQRSLETAANLENLLPTGTVLAVEALKPSFPSNRECTPANKYLTIGLIACSAMACFLSSFTYSFISKDGKLYHVIATFKGLYLFNDIDGSDGVGSEELDDKKECKIITIDFLHAFTPLIVFLVFVFSRSDLQGCFFATKGDSEQQLIKNLTLVAGILASFFFMIFSTERREIGYMEIQQQMIVHISMLSKKLQVLH